MLNSEYVIPGAMRKLRMAKHTYTKKGPAKTVRYLAALVLLALLALVVWKVGFHTPKGPLSMDTADLDRRIQDQANLQDPPPLTQDPPPEPPTESTEPAAPNPPQETPPPAVPVEPTPEPPSPAQQLLQQAQSALTAAQYLPAREKLSDAVRIGLPPEQDQIARNLVNKTTDHWLFAKTALAGDEFCSYYVIKSGDALARIAPKYLVPKELLATINGLKNPDKINLGQRLKVVQGPFTATVDRQRFLMSVYLGDLLVRSYPVGLGAPGKETPTGLWRVSLKQPNPAWTDEETGIKYLPNDPDNPLGERWIALEGLEGDAVGRQGFGIHGTIKPEEIGHQASRGCIRLYNGDVRELYDLLVSGHSLVRVEN